MESLIVALISLTIIVGIPVGIILLIYKLIKRLIKYNADLKKEQYAGAKCNRTVTHKDDYERWKEQRLKESAPDRPEYESKDGER